MARPPYKRIIALDSLRGIAALVVLSQHLILIFDIRKGSPASLLLHYSPLKLLIIGHSAVLVFYVLSGFALTALLHSGLTYCQYVVRRLCRIVLPLVAATVLSLALYFLIHPHPIPEANDWINDTIWTTPPSLSMILNGLCLTGRIKDVIIGPVTWTLVHELRISLMFPSLYWFCRRYPRCAPIVSIGLFFIAQSIMAGNHISGFGSFDLWENCVVSLYYTPFFILGYYLCENYGYLKQLADRVSPRLQVALAIAIFLLLVDAHDLLRGLGAAALVVASTGRGLWSRLLLSRPCVFVGHISYSLYLLHIIVMVAVFQIFTNVGSPILLAGLTAVASVTLAGAFHRVFEAPAIRLGRVLANALNPWR